MRRPIKERLKRLRRDERGAGAVEFALIAPVLAIVAAGVVDASRLILQTMQLRAAAQAGADYALRNPWDPIKVTGAVTASGAVTAPTPTATMANQCPSATGVADPTNGVCPSGAAPGKFVTVTATSTYKPLFVNMSLLTQRTLTATTVVRIP